MPREVCALLVLNPVLRRLADHEPRTQAAPGMARDANRTELDHTQRRWHACESRNFFIPSDLGLVQERRMSRPLIHDSSLSTIPNIFAHQALVWQRFRRLPQSTCYEGCFQLAPASASQSAGNVLSARSGRCTRAALERPPTRARATHKLRSMPLEAPPGYPRQQPTCMRLATPSDSHEMNTSSKTAAIWAIPADPRHDFQARAKSNTNCKALQSLELV